MTENYQTILIAFIITLLVYFLLTPILGFIKKQTSKTKTKLDDYLLQGLIAPLKVSILLIFFYFSLSILQVDYPQITPLIFYFKSLFIVIILWLFLRLISQIEKYLTVENQKLDRDNIRLLAKLIKAVVVALLGLSILQYFGVSIASILAFGGVGGMVIGFAAKDMLANIFGGLMIGLDKPFSVGDWVRVGSVEGTVESIGWRMTRIRTFSKNPIYVPNSQFSVHSIETPSRMTNRRIYETLGISYDDINKLPSLIHEIETYLNNNNAIDDKTLTMVYFNRFNDSSLDLVVYTFTKTTNWVEFQKTKSEILLDIAKIINDIGASIAYPTQTLLMKNETLGEKNDE